jgi:hypothetical protein
MSVLFHLRRGRAVLGATAVLLTLVLVSTAGAMPARDPAGTATPAVAAANAQQAYYASYGDAQPIAPPAAEASDSTSRPSWLGFALAAGAALLLGAVAGSASTAVVRRTRSAGLVG